MCGLILTQHFELFVNFQASNPLKFASSLKDAKCSRHMRPRIPISDLGMPFGLPHFLPRIRILEGLDSLIFHLLSWGCPILRLPHLLKSNFGDAHLQGI